MSACGVARIGDSIGEARTNRRQAALIAYLMAGYPDHGGFLASARSAFGAGASVLEVGVPFSDPVADGKVIQSAGEVALRNGVTLRKTIGMVATLRRETDRPIVLMSYLNPILSMGFERFVDSALAAEIDGVIVPDLLPDEAASEIEIARSRGFALVFLTASNATDDRLGLAMAKTTGFLYSLALAGVTGERESLDGGLLPFVGRLRRIRETCPAKPPIAVGFGVSKPEHYALLRDEVDAVVVGSALVRRSATAPSAVGEFIRSLGVSP